MPTLQSLKKTLDEITGEYAKRARLAREALPTLAQWKKLPSLLSQRERVVFWACVTGLVLSVGFLGETFYTRFTVPVPVRGGSMTEGVVGSPRFLNPLYSEAYDVDRDIVQLVYSGLLRYDGSGTLVPDLAKDVTVSEDGKVIEMNLREDAVWHDGKPFSADDVIFTIGAVQDPRYKSPIRANWIGVTAEKISEHRVRFELREAYAPFLDRLTVKILPAHLWKDIAPENAALSLYNLQPVGTGPYAADRVVQDRSGTIQELRLKANKEYYGKIPYISSFTFRFFSSDEELAASAEKREIDAFSLRAPDEKKTLEGASYESYLFSLPRYFAVFFNLNAPKTDDSIKIKEVRRALADLVDRDSIVRDVFGGNARSLSSLLPPSIIGLSDPDHPQQKNISEAEDLLNQKGFIKENGAWVQPKRNRQDGIRGVLQTGSRGTEVKKLQECLAQDTSVYPSGKITGTFDLTTKDAVMRFQEKYADEILAPQNLTKGTGKVAGGTKDKLNALCFSSKESVPLRVTITTVDQQPLTAVAQRIARQWKDFGIATDVQALAPADLERDALKPRNYEMLLFGEILGKIPDLFPFWHSSQARDPGLNLSGYGNKKADALLEAIRKDMDEQDRKQKYQDLQNVILADVPAIFLYDAHYTYTVSKDINGIRAQMIGDPSQRFAGVSDWYMRTARTWK